MSIRVTTALSASALLFGLSLLPSQARAASLDKCGGIFLSAASSCEFKPVQECKTTCSTTSVEQVCSAKTSTMCSSSCTTTDTTSCVKTRTDSCKKECETISSKSSHEVCVSECTDECTSDATSKGKFHGDNNVCGKACAHNCNARCDSCSTSDQDTECMTKCTSIVENECTEQVNRDCVLDCQTDTYESCQTDTVNTCNTSCTDKGGAIFCDGQFLEASNLQDCADQLAAEFSFNIDVNIHATVNGNGTVTTTNSDGSKTTSSKCSYGPAPRNGAGMFVGALAALGVVVARRRRRA